MKVFAVFICSVLTLVSADTSIRFLLYTNSHRTAHLLDADDPQSLIRSSFDPGHPTRIIIFGYSNTMDHDVVPLIRDAYLRRGDFNVIAVDWTKLANDLYSVVVSHMPIVARETTKMIGALMSLKGLSLETLTLVGFSLGAHIAGQVGRDLLPHKIEAIVALDPATPLIKPSQWVSKEDALYVQVIHTRTWMVALEENLGHADFYPNYGFGQPTCGLLDLQCSHTKSYYYFSETINDPFKFMGQRCKNESEFKQKTCSWTGIECQRMGGEPLDKGAEGVFYVKVPGGDSDPFWRC